MATILTVADPEGEERGPGARRGTAEVMPWLIRHRVVALAVVCALAIGGTTFSLVRSRHSATTTAAYQRLVPLQEVTGHAYYLFRSTVLDHNYGRLAVASTTDPNTRALTPLKCARVSFSGGRGLCVTNSGGLFGATKGIIFNSQFAQTGTVTLQGFPNRVQVSPDGRYGAATDFVNGDTYATAGFSTRTDIIDLQTGRILFDLEKLHVTRNGSVYSEVNFNFWGVTFARDDQHFYATLGSGTSTDLIEGDLSTMKAEVLRSGVECPSLSPDGTRIAFKSRLPGATVRWRLSVLNLATLQSRPLAETRSVDDQAYWLNNTTVAYGLAEGANGGSSADGISSLTAGGSVATDMWTVPADGSGSPQLLMQGAWSTVAVP